MKEQLLEMLPALRRFAYSLTNSPHDADDLLQSTAERLLSREIPADANLNKWAFTVCRNLWIDEYRARRTRQVAQWDPTLMEGMQVDGGKQIQQAIELDEINRAMRSLSEEQHLVLSMVAVQGLSYQDVAEELGIPKGTVMSRLARARTTLADLLHAGKGQASGEPQ